MTTSSPLPVFSGDKLDYSNFRREVLNRASTASTTCTEGQGLLGFLLPADEWIATLTRAGLPAPAAFIPLAHPGDRPGAAAHFPAWKLDLDQYLEQRQDINKFKMLLRAALDDVSLVAMDTDDDGASSLSLAQMLAILDGMHRLLSPSDLCRNSDKLLVPFQPGSAIRAFITAQRRAHLVAAANSFPIPETTKIRSLITALAPCGTFNPRIEAWTMAVPTAAAQTFDLLAAAIIEYADNHDPAVTTGTQSYASRVSHIAAQTAVHAAAPAFSSDQLAAIVKLVAAAVQSVPSKATRAHGPSKHYCWTHGYGAHTGMQCLHPASGHVAAASGKNPQGGSAKGRHPN